MVVQTGLTKAHEPFGEQTHPSVGRAQAERKPLESALGVRVLDKQGEDFSQLLSA